MTPLREAVKLARDTFLDYADKHDRKGTEEGKRKAQENRAIACKMDEALQQPDPLELLEEVLNNDVRFDLLSHYSGSTISCQIYGRIAGKDFDSLVEIFEDFTSAIEWLYVKAKELYPYKDWRH